MAVDQTASLSRDMIVGCPDDNAQSSLSYRTGSHHTMSFFSGQQSTMNVTSESIVWFLNDESLKEGI